MQELYIIFLKRLFFNVNIGLLRMLEIKTAMHRLKILMNRVDETMKLTDTKMMANQREERIADVCNLRDVTFARMSDLEGAFDRIS